MLGVEQLDLDETHDPARMSWVESAHAHRDFPIQNLPIGIFAPAGGAPRAGIAIGDHILDLPALLDTPHLTGPARAAAETTAGHTLNRFLALDTGARRAFRAAISAILTEGHGAERDAPRLLHAARDCRLLLPAAIGDYTDFYAGLHHATAVGKLFRPDAPLMPNYKHVPIAYHGRASSVRESGVPVRRPNGQRKPADRPAPDFGPCRNLDFELEFGIWLGPGNGAGEPIDIAQAADHIAGFCLLNDWSARDIQAWEYQPLGPFLAKSFATTISPWIVSPEALAPFRAAQPARDPNDPRPLPYLWNEADQATGAYDITLEAWLATPMLPEPFLLARSNTLHAYWTFAQMVAHHTSNGCDLRPADLFGSGTLSGPDPTGCGSLLELTQGGRAPLKLPNGEARRFLQDGDEILLTAHASRKGFASIGFGACRAKVVG